MKTRSVPQPTPLASSSRLEPGVGNGPMFPGLLAFECRYQTRRAAFLAVTLFFVLVGFALAQTGFGGPDLAINAPHAIAQSLAITTLLAVLVTTMLAAHGALRDSEHRMTEIVYATAVTRRDYVVVRFAGIAAALGIAFCGVLPGLWLGTFAVRHDAGAVLPFALGSYLWPLLLLVVPNLLWVSAVLYAVALVSRSTAATYVSGVLLYCLYFATALFSGSPLMAGTSPPSARGMAIAAVADPFGMSALYEQTRYWSAAERESRLLDLSGNLLINRLLWLGVTAAILVGLYRWFSFRLPAAASGPTLALAPAGGVEPQRTATLSPATSVAKHPGAWLRDGLAAFWGVLRIEVSSAVRGWPFKALVVGWIAVSTIEMAQTFRHNEFGTALVPTTSLILHGISQPLSLFALLLVIYFAAEVVWRERVAGMHEIVDATPVSNTVLLLAKIGALGALVGVLIVTASVSATAFQLVAGGVSSEPQLFVPLLLFIGLPVLLVAALSVAIQTLVPNRHLGILVSAVAVLYWHLGALGGPDHPLLRFAGLPEIPHSDLTGFGPETVSFGWFGAYWAAFVVVLVGLVHQLWRRGTDPRLGQRWRATRLLANGPGRWLIAAGLLAFVGLGAWVFQQTNRRNTYRTAEEVERWKAAYERTYRPLETAPQPTLVAALLTVDLEPEHRRYALRGHYQLENRNRKPLETFSITLRRDLSRAVVRVAGREPTAVDVGFGTYHFSLSPPLEPGEQTRLDFDLAVARGGAVAGGTDHSVVAGGSFVLGTLVMPGIGYRRSYEIADPDARVRQGLGPRDRALGFEAGDSNFESDAVVPAHFDVTLTTAPGEIALAPGELVEQGERDGRPLFRYRTNGPISPVVAFASGRYTVARRDHRGVALEVYHHPTHQRNVDHMLTVMARAIDYGSSQFGPYPHSALRLVEVASSSPLRQRGSGFAVPSLIFIAEDRGFLTDRTDTERVDVVAKRVAHEVAHQWWGHQVSPIPAPGAAAIVETLARYTETRVLAGIHGEDAAAEILAYELDRYLRGRAGGDETPLVEVEDQPHIYYAKGAVVMEAIRDLIGETATNAALRQLVDDVAGGTQPTARDLVGYLGSEATAAQRGLIERWWTDTRLYDLRLAAAIASPADPASGRVRLELTIEATTIDPENKLATPRPIDEEIEVALYADDPGWSGLGGPPLELRRVRVGDHNPVSFEIDGRARYVLLDPNVLRIDRNRADNLRQIVPTDG